MPILVYYTSTTSTMYQPHLANIKFGDGFQLFGAVERVRGGVRNTAVE